MTTPTERDEIIAELAITRGALIQTTNGLTDEQAGERSTVSALCVGGIVKHVTAMENAWLRFAVGDLSAMSYELPEGVTWEDFMSGSAREFPQWAIEHQDNLRMLPGETLADVLERYRQVAVRSEETIATISDLSASYPLPEAPWNPPGAVRSVRQVLLHVIAETAQHAGHADILRESLDGQTST